MKAPARARADAAAAQSIAAITPPLRKGRGRHGTTGLALPPMPSTTVSFNGGPAVPLGSPEAGRAMYDFVAGKLAGAPGNARFLADPDHAIGDALVEVAASERGAREGIDASDAATRSVVEANEALKAKRLRELAGRDPEQTDIEEFTGVAEKQQKREAEAGGIASDRLRSIVERVERLEEEKKALSADIKDIFQEAKSAGFDTKVVRHLIKLRRQEPAEVEEQETLLELYRRALGM